MTPHLIPHDARLTAGDSVTHGARLTAQGSRPGSHAAVYVHIPWCASLCPYCDFDKQASEFGLRDDYIDAVVQHIEATGKGQPAEGDAPGSAVASRLLPVASIY